MRREQGVVPNTATAETKPRLDGDRPALQAQPSPALDHADGLPSEALHRQAQQAQQQ